MTFNKECDAAIVMEPAIFYDFVYIFLSISCLATSHAWLLGLTIVALKYFFYVFSLSMLQLQSKPSGGHSRSEKLSNQRKRKEEKRRERNKRNILYILLERYYFISHISHLCYVIELYVNYPEL